MSAKPRSSAHEPSAQRSGRHLRLLSCNILAGASVQRYSEYFTRSINAVLPGRSKLDNLDRLAEVLPQFDVIGLQEADAGSLRSGFLNQTRYLAETAGMPFWSHQPNRPIARLSHTANGLISRLEPQLKLRDLRGRWLRPGTVEYEASRDRRSPMHGDADFRDVSTGDGHRCAAPDGFDRLHVLWRRWIPGNRR